MPGRFVKGEFDAEADRDEFPSYSIATMPVAAVPRLIAYWRWPFPVAARR
jgi:hypothetical protein